MKIILAKSAGFCYGVKRAIKLAEQTLKTKPKPIQMIGDLVHNEFVVTNLKKLGLVMLNNLKDLKRGSFIIQSHGLPQKLIKKLSRRNLSIIDTTCPKVKKTAYLAQYLEKNGYQIVIFGDKNHDEIKTISSTLKNGPLIIKNITEINKIRKNNKIGLLSQTTKSDDEFYQLVNQLIPMTKNLKYFNTICPASQARQREAKDLAKKVDLMLVIGSTKSANTLRLFQICKNYKPLTYLIESDNFIKKKWLKKIKTVGLTAGASTPDFVIKNVVKKLKLLSTYSL
jgi:4-hydroxy-3-methylbut-2-enyl diphosphate reductase